jgi:Nucleoside-diphosphate-sugar epimerases
MLSDKKILITGATGQIGFPVARFLAEKNEVWGVARFTDEQNKQHLERLGVSTFTLDLNSNDYGTLPTDFDHVVHFAVFQGPVADYDLAISNNAEATGILMQHCRSAKSVLIASTNSVYKPNENPWHLYSESDPLGDSIVTHSPTNGISKISQEAVGRSGW